MIQSPNAPELLQLCDQLRVLTPAEADEHDLWPAEKLKLCAEAGIYRWFVPKEAGGAGWSQADIVAGYLKLSAACLNTTFVLTQQVAALRRVAGTANPCLRQTILPELVVGTKTATVGISHLTTSRRHLGKPALQAEANKDGFLVNGYSPWVTGGCGADYLVMGAELTDGSQILFAADSNQTGITIDPGNRLMALTASQTGAVRCSDVWISPDRVIDGPKPSVLSAGKGGGAGGLQTSTLAIGLARAAVDFIGNEAERRDDLRSTFSALDQQWQGLESDLLELASGQAKSGDLTCATQDLRAEANNFVLRSTQAALIAAKGAGYVQGHPVERWCREAMFFLVWSCPQPVLQSNLCHFAGIESS